MGGSDLWNAVMMRPIRTVAVPRGKGATRDALILPTHTVAEAGSRVLRRQIEYFMSRAYGLEYPEDIEFVHEMRVVTRRMRVILRIFREALGTSYPSMKARLAGITDAFGGARDADVSLAFLERFAHDLGDEHCAFIEGLAARERARRIVRYRELHRKIDSAVFRRFRGDLNRLLRKTGLPGAGAAAGKRVVDEAPRMLRRRLKDVLRFEGDLRLCRAEELHRLRIACKRLRYTAEFLADLYPGRLAELITAMVKLQGLLGIVHDGDVYAARVRDYRRRCGPAEPGGAAARSAATLCAHLAERRRAGIEEAEVVWRRFTARRGLRRLLDTIRAPYRDE